MHSHERLLVIIIIIIIRRHCYSDFASCSRCYCRVFSQTVCLSVSMHPAEAVGGNEMPFGRDIRVVPSNIVLLGRGPSPPQEREIWGIDLGIKTRSKFALQIAAEPLQIAELLLYAAYRNSVMPYPTVPSLTP